ncbi:NAD(P)H-dependent flavin oxidoreductase [Caldimonas brevitalea]|nr:nitronate monooxygenase [Caldimonas brevitalea]
MKAVNAIRMGGVELLPLVEGGKGVGVSNGVSAGHWARAGGVGTFSAALPDSFDEGGRPVRADAPGRTRQERHETLIAQSIRGAIAQARRAHDIAGPNGRVHVNVLWEMGGAERILDGMLEGAAGLIHGVTCGAGMPYRLSEIAAKYGVHYYPIVSSARAFNALWKRAYAKTAELLGAVVYEDPWLAGGHNGLSNSEDPDQPADPYPRVLELRKSMRGFGLDSTPIIMAGGVWWLEEWEHWIDNPELGPIAFQLGTRPLLTQESPIGQAWKQRLRTLKQGDVLLNRFSPTGFYSSAVHNGFLQELYQRLEHEIPYATEPTQAQPAPLQVGPHQVYYVTPSELERAEVWRRSGFTEDLRTPDQTLIFVTPEKADEIRRDQKNCIGCLSQCRFSSWSQHTPSFSSGAKADPRSFCIQKTLQEVRDEHADDAMLDRNLMFGGHNAYRFASDPFYANGFTPTVKQLVDRLMTGR